MFVNMSLADAFSNDYPGVLGFRENDLRAEVPFSSLYQGHMVSTCLFTEDEMLDHLAEVGFARFLHCKVTFLPFHMDSLE